jgi:hypothetical protein
VPRQFRAGTRSPDSSGGCARSRRSALHYPTPADHFEALRSAPRYPASAHKCSRLGKDSPTCSSNALAASRSARSAGCTFAFITRARLCPPKGGVCGRLPSWLRRILAPPFFCGPHRLSDQDGRARAHLATFPKAGSLPQSSVDSLPGAIDAPGSKVVEGRLPGREVVGKQAPGASSPLTT